MLAIFETMLVGSGDAKRGWNKVRAPSWGPKQNDWVSCAVRHVGTTRLVMPAELKLRDRLTPGNRGLFLILTFAVLPRLAHI
jgi:hypothetical protein